LQSGEGAGLYFRDVELLEKEGRKVARPRKPPKVMM
jgi:hypothetical protein